VVDVEERSALRFLRACGTSDLRSTVMRNNSTASSQSMQRCLCHSARSKEKWKETAKAGQDDLQTV